MSEQTQGFLSNMMQLMSFMQQKKQAEAQNQIAYAQLDQQKKQLQASQYTQFAGLVQNTYDRTHMADVIQTYASKFGLDPNALGAIAMDVAPAAGVIQSGTAAHGLRVAAGQETAPNDFLGAVYQGAATREATGQDIGAFTASNARAAAINRGSQQMTPGQHAVADQAAFVGATTGAMPGQLAEDAFNAGVDPKKRSAAYDVQHGLALSASDLLNDSHFKQQEERMWASLQQDKVFKDLSLGLQEMGVRLDERRVSIEATRAMMSGAGNPIELMQATQKTFDLLNKPGGSVMERKALTAIANNQLKEMTARGLAEPIGYGPPGRDGKPVPIPYQLPTDGSVSNFSGMSWRGGLSGAAVGAAGGSMMGGLPGAVLGAVGGGVIGGTMAPPFMNYIGGGH